MVLENNLDVISNQNIKNSIEETNKSLTSIVITYFLWILFVSNAAYLIFNFSSLPEWNLGNIFRINGFTILIWSTVTFFSAIVSTYASSYLKGFRFHSRFMMLCLGFTLSVMLLVMSNNVLLLIFS